MNGENFSFTTRRKTKDEIRKSKPENSFFEKYRNTGIVKGEKSDLPEQMLAYFDGRTAKTLEEIRKSNFKENLLTPENLYTIRFFLATTFWRIPKNDKVREETIEKYSFKDLGFGIFDKQTGERNKELEDTIKEINLFRKIYTSLLPLVSFMDKYKMENYGDWTLIHRTNPNHITGDNPIIMKGKYHDFSSIQKDLIMPLSSKKILLCTDKKNPKSFHPVFNLKMDMIILHQAERFVCSSNEEYLRLIVEKSYKMSVGKNWEEKIIEDIFSYFE